MINHSFYDFFLLIINSLAKLIYIILKLRKIKLNYKKAVNEVLFSGTRV